LEALSQTYDRRRVGALLAYFQEGLISPTEAGRVLNDGTL